jgi:hypothetical protein
LAGGANLALGVYDLSNAPAAATSAYTLLWSGSTSNVGLQFLVSNEIDIAPTFVAVESKQNTANGASLVINLPTSPETVQDGDLMVAAMAASTGSTCTWTPPAGWTEVADQNGSKPCISVAYKVASSESGPYTFTASATGLTLTGAILVYRYAAYDTIGSFSPSTGDPVSVPSVTASFSQSLALAVAAVGGTGITMSAPAGMTARFTDNDATYQPNMRASDQPVAKGPTGNRNITTGGGSNPAGIIMLIKPTRSLS